MLLQPWLSVQLCWAMSGGLYCIFTSNWTIQEHGICTKLLRLPCSLHHMKMMAKAIKFDPDLGLCRC